MEWKKPRFIIAKIQPDFKDPLSFLEKFPGPIEEETRYELTPLVMELSIDSETTMLRFLEQQPRGINWDKIQRRRYLLSGTIKALRELYLELKEQKVAKALLIFLCEHFPSFFEDLWPKHGIVPPIGISFRILSREDLETFDLSLRLRHEYLLSEFELASLEVLELYRSGLTPIIVAEEEVLILPEAPEQDFFWPESSGRLRPYFLPKAAGLRGYLLAPLLTYFSFITRIKAQAEHLLRPVIGELFLALKERYPDPFGLLPED